MRRFAGKNTFALFRLRINRNATYGGLGLLLDTLLCLHSAVPMGGDETAFLLERFFEFVVGVYSGYHPHL